MTFEVDFELCQLDAKQFLHGKETTWCKSCVSSSLCLLTIILACSGDSMSPGLQRQWSSVSTTVPFSSAVGTPRARSCGSRLCGNCNRGPAHGTQCNHWMPCGKPVCSPAVSVTSSADTNPARAKSLSAKSENQRRTWSHGWLVNSRPALPCKCYTKTRHLAN